jgi:hypothetical protein
MVPARYQELKAIMLKADLFRRLSLWVITLSPQNGSFYEEIVI